jgi:demethylmenaquinone methyltransferase/2-methoxy-6-polyprenyl-1,4-benzoquinol methylase
MSEQAAGAHVPRRGSGEMFDGIAARYDLLNRINSLGLDRGWRKRTIRALGVEQGHRVLDLATGTADVLLEVARQVPGAELVGLDPSAGMLDIGREKLARAGLKSELQLGDAQALPFADASFDRITMAFGIRNVPDRRRALLEMLRVLSPGGKVGILELAEPRAGLLGAAARFHVHHVVPRVGALLSRGDDYRYLQASIAAFPPAEAFAEMMREVGFSVERVEALAFGACTLFVGQKGA